MLYIALYSIYSRYTVYIGGRPDPRSSVRCSYPPLVTALLQTVADSVQTCNASFASFSKLASLASFASMQVWRALFWHSSAKFECRFGGFRRFRRFFPKSLRTFDKIWVSSKKRKSRRGVQIAGNHTGFCGGPRGGRWITAEGSSSSPIFGESFGRPVEFSCGEANPYNL